MPQGTREFASRAQRPIRGGEAGAVNRSRSDGHPILEGRHNAVMEPHKKTRLGAGSEVAHAALLFPIAKAGWFRAFGAANLLGLVGRRLGWGWGLGFGVFGCGLIGHEKCL